LCLVSDDINVAAHLNYFPLCCSVNYILAVFVSDFVLLLITQTSASAMLPKGMAPNPQLPIETILRSGLTSAGSTYGALGTLHTANGKYFFK